MGKAASFFMLFVEAFKEYVRDKSTNMASALAYNELLAVGPFIGFIFYVTGKIWGMEVLYQEVVPMLKNTFTPQLTKVLTMMLLKKIDIHHQDLGALSVYSSLLLLWAAKKYFGQIKQTIDVSWNKRRYKFGVIPYLQRAIKSFKIAGVTTMIILLILFLRLLLPFFHVNDPGSEQGYWMFKISQWITGFFIVFSVKMFYFTFIPPVKTFWKNAIPGAVLNGILFLIGREIMEVHFSERPDANIAESIIMVLLWFYYSNLVFIYSAEFNKLYVSRKQNIDLSKLTFD